MAIDLFSADPTVSFVELDDDTARQFNQAADQYYHRFANVDYESNKPFANYREAAMISFQIGLLLAGAKIGRAQQILEFGAGAGWLASLVHRLGNELTLLEVSPKALEMAQETFRRDTRNGVHAVGPHFDLYDGFRFPYGDECFDRILCFDALHHVPNPARILGEMQRVLRPGGVAGFVESGRRHAELPAIIDCVSRTGILERNTRLDEIHALAQAAGFTGLTIKAFPTQDAWEVDYETYQRRGLDAIDTAEIASGFDAGNQSVFMLHKGPFAFDGTYPSRPAVRIEPDTARVAARAGERFSLGLRLTNTGRTRLNATSHPLGGYAALGAHLFAGGEVVNFDLVHHPLPGDLELAASCRLSVELTAPAMPGRYELEWDVVIEGVQWLAQVGSPTARVALEVAP